MNPISSNDTTDRNTNQKIILQASSSSSNIVQNDNNIDNITNPINPRKRSRELLYLDENTVRNPFEIVSKKPRFVFEGSQLLGKVENFLRESERFAHIPPPQCDPQVIEAQEQEQEKPGIIEKSSKNYQIDSNDDSSENEEESSDDENDSSTNDEDETDHEEDENESPDKNEEKYVEMNVTLGLFEPKERKDEEKELENEENFDSPVRIEAETDKKDVIFNLLDENSEKKNDFRLILPHDKKTKEIRENKATESLMKVLFE